MVPLSCHVVTRCFSVNFYLFTLKNRTQKRQHRYISILTIPITSVAANIKEKAYLFRSLSLAPKQKVQHERPCIPQVKSINSQLIVSQSTFIRYQTDQFEYLLKFYTETYPETGDGKFKCTLWTFKQWLALKMRVHYGMSIVLLLTSSNKTFSGYVLNIFSMSSWLKLITENKCASFIGETHNC